MPKISSKTIGLILVGLALVILLLNFFFFQQKILWSIVFVFFGLNFLLFFYFLRFFSHRILLVSSQIERLKEEVNILSIENLKNHEQSLALKFKIERYSNLKKLIEDLNRSLKLDLIVNVLSSAVYTLISRSCGTVLLYLVDNQYQKLSLVHSIKDDSDLVILSKEGDIFDQWVLRHSTQLLIENLRNDFRFDSAILSQQDMRQVLSLISSPLISHNSLLGLLRLENKNIQSFNQDDLRFLALVSDLGAVALENSLLFQKTQDLAIHDDLTALYTKHYFIGRFKDEARRAQRLEEHLSLLMIDIDFFKQYNDKFGHTAGDIVLKRVGLLLNTVLSKFDPLVCRFGGEEFLIMLSGINKKETLVIADDLRQKIAQEKIILRRQDTQITVSIGIANLPQDTKDEDELIQKADKAMYQAKSKGRNQICCI